MDSNGRPLGAQTIQPAGDTLATSSEVLNNGRTTVGSADIPISSSIATHTPTLNATISTQDGLVYLYAGVGITAGLILAVIVCTIVLISVKCVLKIRRAKPSDTAEASSVKNSRDAKLFSKIVTEDKVIYMRTAEGIKQFPDLQSEPIYEIVDFGIEHSTFVSPT